MNPGRSREAAASFSTISVGQKREGWRGDFQGTRQPRDPPLSVRHPRPASLAVHQHATIRTDGHIPFQLRFLPWGGRKKAPWCILLWLRQIYPKWKGRWKRLTSSTNLSKRHSAGFPQQHPRGKGGFRMTWGPCLSPTEDSELIKITNCTCHICHLFNLYVMRWNPCRGVKVVSAEGDAAGKRSPQH